MLRGGADAASPDKARGRERDRGPRLAWLLALLLAAALGEVVRADGELSAAAPAAAPEPPVEPAR